MVGSNMIQIQGLVSEPIGVIINKTRTAVSNICLGIDDMHLLGNKALVLRTEIYTENLPNLYTDLASIGIKLNEKSIPDIKTLKKGVEYLLSIQIISLSEGSDKRICIPKV